MEMDSGEMKNIDQLAAQIEALKEKLVEERAIRIFTEYGHFLEYEWADIDAWLPGTKNKKRDEAREQLKAEMPEVDWDE